MCKQRRNTTILHLFRYILYISIYVCTYLCRLVNLHIKGIQAASISLSPADLDQLPHRQRPHLHELTAIELFQRHDLNIAALLHSSHHLSKWEKEKRKFCKTQPLKQKSSEHQSTESKKSKTKSTENSQMVCLFFGVREPAVRMLSVKLQDLI